MCRQQVCPFEFDSSYHLNTSDRPAVFYALGYLYSTHFLILTTYHDSQFCLYASCCWFRHSDNAERTGRNLCFCQRLKYSFCHEYCLVLFCHHFCMHMGGGPPKYPASFSFRVANMAPPRASNVLGLNCTGAYGPMGNSAMDGLSLSCQRTPRYECYLSLSLLARSR